MATVDRPRWRRSSFTNNGSFCVEVDPGPGSVRVRDTKDRGTGPVLVLDAAALRAAAGTAPGRAGGLRVATDVRETVQAGETRTTTRAREPRRARAPRSPTPSARPSPAWCTPGEFRLVAA